MSSGTLDDTMTVLTRVGPLGKLLREAPAHRRRVEPKVRAALMARAGGREPTLRAATWLVTATRE